MSVARRVTLEGFLALPDTDGRFFDFHELHDGEVVSVPPPTVEHMDVQARIEQQLRALLGPFGFVVRREFYYTLPDQARRADIAAVHSTRLAAQRHTVFRGAPDLIVEELSPSNTALDLNQLRRSCLETDTEQFWVIDPFARTVEVFGRSGTWTEFRQGEIVRFTIGGRDLQVPVTALFAE